MSFTIPIPKSPFIDTKTGLISRDWYLFLVNLFQSNGSGLVGTTTQVLHGGGAGYSQVSMVSDVTGVLPGVNGGTGVSNPLKSVTLGGNILLGGALTTTPSNDITFSTVGATSVSLPLSGTLITGVSLSGDVFATGTNTGTAVATITSGAITTSKISAGAVTVTQISSGAVTNVKLADMPPNTFKANNTGVTSSPTDITPTQALSILGLGVKTTSSLTVDVSLNNTANYFDGPTVSQGTSGTWFVAGTVTVVDTGAIAAMFAKLWDGTTVVDSAVISLTGINVTGTLALSGIFINPVGNIRISVRDPSATSGAIKANTTGLSMDSTITAFRIA